MSEKMSAEELEEATDWLLEGAPCDYGSMYLAGVVSREHVRKLILHISTLQREADGMREALAAHEKRTAFMRKISPHVAAMLDEYDAPVAAVLSEGCGSPQATAAEGSD